MVNQRVERSGEGKSKEINVSPQESEISHRESLTSANSLSGSYFFQTIEGQIFEVCVGKKGKTASIDYVTMLEYLRVDGKKHHQSSKMHMFHQDSPEAEISTCRALGLKESGSQVGCFPQCGIPSHV